MQGWTSDCPLFLLLFAAASTVFIADTELQGKRKKFLWLRDKGGVACPAEEVIGAGGVKIRQLDENIRGNIPLTKLVGTVGLL